MKTTTRHHFKPNFSGLSCEYKLGRSGNTSRTHGSQVINQHCAKPENDPVHFPAEKGMCASCEQVFASVEAAEDHVENSPYCVGPARKARPVQMEHPMH